LEGLTSISFLGS